jgi:predicted amidohydrolase YtcJ
LRELIAHLESPLPPVPSAARGPAPSPRICGIKIFADGAIGAGTAAIYGTYASQDPPLGLALGREGVQAREAPETSGQLIYAPERLKQMVRTAADAGYQVAVHSIGDYSTDLVLNAFEETENPARHRIEHAMLLSDAQIERLASLGPHVAMQPEFLVRFAHAYKRQLGPERASQLKRFRSIKDAGLRLSLNSDRPIVSGDPWAGVEVASNRPGGFDPAENLTREEAILGYTVFGAMALEDEGDYGSLEVGQRADWVVV